MTAAKSLLASSEAYLAIGDEVSAAFCKRMADDASALGPIGEQLYRHFASEAAERASVKLQQFNMRKDAA